MVPIRLDGASDGPGRRMVEWRQPSSSGCCGDEHVLDDPAADQMLLDDPLEHRRIALRRTRRPRDRRRRSGRLRRCAGSSPWCGGCRPARTGPAPSAAASEIPTPPGRDPCRSTSASSDRSRERCAAARPERRCSRRSLVVMSSAIVASPESGFRLHAELLGIPRRARARSAAPCSRPAPTRRRRPGSPGSLRRRGPCGSASCD